MMTTRGRRATGNDTQREIRLQALLGGCPCCVRPLAARSPAASANELATALAASGPDDDDDFIEPPPRAPRELTRRPRLPLVILGQGDNRRTITEEQVLGRGRRLNGGEA